MIVYMSVIECPWYFDLCPLIIVAFHSQNVIYIIGCFYQLHLLFLQTRKEDI